MLHRKPEVKAYAMSDTQLRCAFPKDICLHTGPFEEVRAQLTPYSLTPPPGAHKVLQSVCRELDAMLGCLSDVLIQERQFLTIDVARANLFDVALMHVTEGCRPHGILMNFDRNALLAILA